MKFGYYDEGVEVSHGTMPPVWIHGGILLLAAFLTFPLWQAFTARGFATASMVAFGIVLSILAHEAAHAWTAVRLGHRATLIRLHAGGGEAIWETDSYSRKDDWLITIAGPLANLCLGLCCLVLYYLILPDPTASFATGPGNPWYSPPPSSPPAILRALHWIAILNLVWTFVNLLPALPLDGGHLFRHFLEVRVGPHRALFWTGLIGTVLAVLSSLIFLVGILGGMAIWSPPEFGPNIRAMKAGRQKRPQHIE